MDGLKLLLVRVFAKLYESSASRFGVQECDIETFGALAWSFVNQTAALLFYLGKRVVLLCSSVLIHIQNVRPFIF